MSLIYILAYFPFLPFIVAAAVLLLLVREARQHRAMLSSLQPDAGRDVLRAARAEASSRIANGPDTSGRPFQSSDAFHWGVLPMLAAPFVLLPLTLGIGTDVAIFLELLLLPAVAWWLTMRRSGVRNAHRLPVVALAASYAAVVLTLAPWQPEIDVASSQQFNDFLLGRWLGANGAAYVAGIVIAAAIVHLVVAVVTINRASNRILDAMLIALTLAVAALFWSFNAFFGVFAAAFAAAIIGYGIARAHRMEVETRTYSRLMSNLAGSTA